MKITECPAQRRTIIYEDRLYYIYVPKHVFIELKYNLYFFLDINDKWHTSRHIPNTDIYGQVCVLKPTLDSFWNEKFTNHRNHFMGDIERLTKNHWWSFPYNIFTPSLTSLFKFANKQQREIISKKGWVGYFTKALAHYEEKEYEKCYFLTERYFENPDFHKNFNLPKYNHLFDLIIERTSKDKILSIKTMAVRYRNSAMLNYLERKAK